MLDVPDDDIAINFVKNHISDHIPRLGHGYYQFISPTYICPGAKIILIDKVKYYSKIFQVYVLVITFSTIFIGW